MRYGAFLLALATMAAPVSATAHPRHSLFGGGGRHGHSINAWMGSHRPKLR